MWEERARRVRGSLASLAAGGPGVAALHAEAIRQVGVAIACDLTCWAVLDPETLVISSMTSGDVRIPAQFEPDLAEAEYATDEPHRFAALAARGTTGARLSDLPRRERSGSIRFSRVWRPLGVHHELRVIFRVDGACWGAAGWVRSGPDFSDREVEFLYSVAPAVAAATRLAVRSELGGGRGSSGPAIAVVDARGAAHSMTAAALDWAERINVIAPGRFTTMMHVMAAGVRRSETGEFHGKVRDVDGRWALLHASWLEGADRAEVAVVLEPAVGRDLVGLMLTAYGLTARERDVAIDVVGGLSTAEIAAHLFISHHTVADHLKAIFSKLDVHSRGQLMAALQPGPS